MVNKNRNRANILIEDTKVKTTIKKPFFFEDEKFVYGLYNRLIYIELGAGLDNYFYEQCLAYELKSLGIKVHQKMEQTFKYKGLEMKKALSINLAIEDLVVIEFKSIYCSIATHISKVLTYMKITISKIGLLLNFNNERMGYSIKRFDSRLN
jgi:GxxExxY protein